MPRGHHLQYPAELRRRLIELARGGRNPEELARQYEPWAQTIRNWVAQSERDGGRRDGGATTEEKQEFARLRRVVEALRKEREILKKRRPGLRGRPARCRPGLRIRERTPGIGGPRLASPRQRRIAAMISGCSIAAITRMRPPHDGHSSTSRARRLEASTSASRASLESALATPAPDGERGESAADE